MVITNLTNTVWEFHEHGINPLEYVSAQYDIDFVSNAQSFHEIIFNEDYLAYSSPFIVPYMTSTGGTDGWNQGYEVYRVINIVGGADASNTALINQLLESAELLSATRLVDATLLNSNLTSIASAIRGRDHSSGTMAFPGGFVARIGNLSPEYFSGQVSVSFAGQTTITITGATDPETGESESVSLTPPYGVVFPYQMTTNTLYVSMGEYLTIAHSQVASDPSQVSDGVILTQDGNIININPYEDGFVAYLSWGGN